ncbi:hypothetical protein FACS1894211_07720 [Clostridia bacterium]|nr:hypothetical protein FACS1894211_07720 [Clostridia bacterium]
MSKKMQAEFTGKEQSEAVFQLFTQRGVVGDSRIDDERIRAAQQIKRKTR